MSSSVLTLCSLFLFSSVWPPSSSPHPFCLLMHLLIHPSSSSSLPLLWPPTPLTRFRCRAVKWKLWGISASNCLPSYSTQGTNNICLLFSTQPSFISWPVVSAAPCFPVFDRQEIPSDVGKLFTFTHARLKINSKRRLDENATATFHFNTLTAV